MVRIIDGRGTGKTGRLMLLAKENDAIFVCSNPKAMEQKAHAYGITGITFMSYTDFISVAHARHWHCKFVIDELEQFALIAGRVIGSGNECIGYTLSEED